jgi:cytidylate kinase
MNAIGAVSRHGISDVAERQMRTWALKLQNQQQLADKRAAALVPKLVYPYLAVSREAGVDARELAQTVASKCGWKLLDRELLDYMSEHDHLSRLTLEFVDERAANWFHEMFGQWLDRQLISQAEYVSRLGKLVLLAAQHESTVFVGRGAQFLLPREAGLAVRVIAPRKQRIDRLMKSRNCCAREAEQFMDENDHARAQFVRRYFHHDVADPHLYDLVLNLAHVSREEAVDMVVQLCQRHS